MKKILIVAGFLLVVFAIQAQNNPPQRPSLKQQDRKAEKRQRINALLKLEEEGDPAQAEAEASEGAEDCVHDVF